jgi:hypothetical protein
MTKPLLELPGQFLSHAEFGAEVGKLLAARNFYGLNGEVVHIIDRPGQEPQVIKVTPEYLADYLNREFQGFETELVRRGLFAND